jgi:hypothetical protein
MELKLGELAQVNLTVPNFDKESCVGSPGCDESWITSDGQRNLNVKVIGG